LGHEIAYYNRQAAIDGAGREPPPTIHRLRADV
jgi:hypothetical protein